MASKTKLTWQKDMAFDVDLDGHKIVLDASEDVGGHDQGVRPKGLLSVALAGCSGMDVVSILKKMKVQEYSLTINVEGEQTEEHPKYYKDILVQYFFNGTDLPPDKLKRAIELSETRYCGVSAMLRKAATISTTIYLNGEQI